MRFKPGQWALIIGGSGGIGLAAAKKLARHGMNLCLVHRDRRAAMQAITPEFEKLKAMDIDFVSFNKNALAKDSTKEILSSLKEKMGQNGRVRLLLHALALGNLKLLAPVPQQSKNTHSVFDRLASELNRPAVEISSAVKKVFNNGGVCLHACVENRYDPDAILDHDDFMQTIHAMGTNIVEWANGLFRNEMFADDARIIALTSEGNRVSWRGYAAVSAAKAALESLSRAMAVEFGPYGIRSNVIQAGVTDTAALRMIPGHEKIRAAALLKNPMGRLTRPADVADAIFLLCTDEASWINGALLRVDGGEGVA